MPAFRASLLLLCMISLGCDTATTGFGLTSGNDANDRSDRDDKPRPTGRSGNSQSNENNGDDTNEESREPIDITGYYLGCITAEERLDELTFKCAVFNRDHEYVGQHVRSVDSVTVSAGDSDTSIENYRTGDDANRGETYGTFEFDWLIASAPAVRKIVASITFTNDETISLVSETSTLMLAQRGHLFVSQADLAGFDISTDPTIAHSACTTEAQAAGLPGRRHRAVLAALSPNDPGLQSLTTGMFYSTDIDALLLLDGEQARDSLANNTLPALESAIDWHADGVTYAYDSANIDSLTWSFVESPTAASGACNSETSTTAILGTHKLTDQWLQAKISSNDPGNVTRPCIESYPVVCITMPEETAQPHWFKGL